MANNDSTTVTNLEAVPSVVADSAELYGKFRRYVETFEVAAADNDGDTYTFFPISLDATIDDIQVANDSVTGGTDYDCGFYKITDGDLGAVIDADILFDGQSMATTRGVWTSLLFAGTNAADQGSVKSKVWEMCGYADIDAARAANQTGQVYVVLTANTVGSATGTVSLKALVIVE